MTIEVSDLTTGVVDGTGVFDVLMRSVDAQLQDQFSKGTITKDQYAMMFNQMTQTAMGQAIQFLQAQQQANVYDSQVKGFQTDALQKVAGTFVDVWNVQRSTDSAIAPNNQNKLVDVNIGQTLEALCAQVGVTLVNSNPPAVTTDYVANALNISGRVGDAESTIKHIKVVDSGGTELVVPNPTLTAEGAFNITGYDVSALVAGVLTTTLTVLTKEFDTVSDTDTAVKN